MIYLERNQVPAHILKGYGGKHIRAEVATEVTIPMDAGLWSGGTRTLYHAIRLVDGVEVPLADHMSAPWADRKDRLFTIPPGVAVVESGSFCGKDAGLHFYVHPDNAATLLPAPAAMLTPTQTVVLKTIRNLISAGRPEEYRRAGLNPAAVDAAKQELLAMGLIDKRGAITIKGCNACPGY